MQELQTRKARLGMVAVILAVVAASPAVAFGYNYYTTDEGKEIRWNSRDIEIVLDDSLALVGDPDEVEWLIIDAFDEWVDAAGLPMEFTFVNGRCDKAFVADGENENCVRAEEDGPIEQGERGAAAFVTYGYDSGEILDADIVVENEVGLWRIGGGEGAYNLRAAVLHEVGHLLGMAHSEVDESRMAPAMTPDDEPGENGLFRDDINGASVLYGGEEIVAADAVQCSIVPVGRSNAGGGWTLFLVAAVLFAVRRRSSEV
jgi:hypothetical protein